jgi:multiple sugar transport system substrate-binding protein
MSKTRKLSTALIAATTLGAGLTSAGLGIPTASAASGAKITTITWAAGAITHTNLRKTMIAMFEKQYPNIKVHLVNEASSTDTTRAELTTQIEGGSTTPDVYLGDVIWPAQFAHNQLAVPLSDHLSKAFFNRFANGLVAGASYQGKVYAAPFFVDSAFLFYRKDLLAKAHLSPPTTWQQVENDSKILQQQKLVKYGFVWQGNSYEGLTCDFMEYLTDAGGKVFNANGSVAINSSQAVKAINTMRNFVTSGVSPRAVTTFQENDSMTSFASGQSAFLRNWSYAWSVSNDKSQSKVVGNVGVTTLPSFTTGKAGYGTIGGWDLYVNPHTQHLQAALDFIDFMTGTKAQTLLAEHYNEIPTNGAVQENPSVKKISPIMAIASKVNFVSRPSSSPQYAAVSTAIYTNVNQALSGGTTAQAAVKKMAQQIQSSNNGGL